MSLSVEHISAYFRAVGDEDEDKAEGDDSDGDENTGRSEEKELKKSKKKGSREARTKTMRRATRAGVRSAALRRSPCSPRTPRSRSTWWSGR